MKLQHLFKHPEDTERPIRHLVSIVTPLLRKESPMSDAVDVEVTIKEANVISRTIDTIKP